jgi:hypothetical protein
MCCPHLAPKYANITFIVLTVPVTKQTLSPRQRNFRELHLEGTPVPNYSR